MAWIERVNKLGKQEFKIELLATMSSGTGCTGGCTQGCELCRVYSDPTAPFQCGLQGGLTLKLLSEHLNSQYITRTSANCFQVLVYHYGCVISDFKF